MYYRSNKLVVVSVKVEKPLDAHCTWHSTAWPLWPHDDGGNVWCGFFAFFGVRSPFAACFFSSFSHSSLHSSHGAVPLHSSIFSALCACSVRRKTKSAGVCKRTGPRHLSITWHIWQSGIREADLLFYFISYWYCWNGSRRRKSVYSLSLLRLRPVSYFLFLLTASSPCVCYRVNFTVVDRLIASFLSNGYDRVLFSTWEEDDDYNNRWASAGRGK